MRGVAVSGYQSPGYQAGTVDYVNLNYSNSLSMMNVDDLPGNMIGE